VESKPGAGRRVVAIVVAVLIVVALFAYYESTVSPTIASSRVQNLESEVTTLQQENNALQFQLDSASNSSQGASNASAIYSAASGSVVTIQGYELISQQTFFGPVNSIESIQGSGFVVSYGGSDYVVTNYHVVDGVTNITATFSDGNSYPASVKGYDSNRDLAVISVKAPASEFRPLVLLSSPLAVAVGEPVYAIGSPFGLQGSMTVGIVSQVGRTITESTASEVSIPDVIQFSAAINPGNSGGPLLDSDGDVIGITTAAVSNSEGLGFAIPASTIARELPDLVTTGTYPLHPYLGIEASADMTYQLAQAIGTNVTYGVLVESVVAGSPAANAGLLGGTRTASVEGQAYQLGGDIIVSVNGTKVVDADALTSYLEEHALAGETIQLGIVRSGAVMTISVKLGSLPSS